MMVLTKPAWIVLLYDRGLSGDGVLRNQSFIDPSLAAIKLMPLQGEGGGVQHFSSSEASARHAHLLRSKCDYQVGWFEW